MDQQYSVQNYKVTNGDKMYILAGIYKYRNLYENIFIGQGLVNT